MGELSSVKILEGLFLIVILVFASLSVNWKILVKTVLLLVIFEGAIRKWFLPGLSQFVYFGKDLIVIIAYLKYFSSLHQRDKVITYDPMMKILIILSFAIILVNSANFSLGSPIIGVFGARNYLIYIPLLFLVGQLFDSQDELASFLRSYLIIALPVVLLGLLQHISPPNSPLNMYVNDEETSKAMLGNRVRVTGTFSYVAGFASYLQTMASLAVPMLIVNQGKKWNFLLKVIIASIVLGIILVGSRGPVVTLILFALGYFVFNEVTRILKLHRQAIVGSIIILGIIFFAFGEALDSFVGRFGQTNDLGMRVLASVTTPFNYSQYGGFFGYGSGATYQASDRIREIFELPSSERIPVFFESEPERIMLELGVIGFFTWYLLRFQLIVLLWRTYKFLTLPLLRELALAAFLTHLLGFIGQMVFQITFNVYYWFLAGFILLLPRLESIEYNRMDEEMEEQ